MMSVHGGKADIAVASRSDFASTSAQARGWGVVKSLPLMGAGPAGPHSHAKGSVFSDKKPTSVVESYKTTQRHKLT